MNLFSNKYIILVIRTAIAVIFIIAGAEKIANPENFALSISNYRLLPVYSINIFAVVLPWIEIISGILLLFGIAVKENSTIILTLLLIFTSAIVISLFRGLSIDCGCFGKGTQIGMLKLGENLLMIIGTFLLTIYDSYFFSLQNKD